jgi:hypothetical protein
MKTTTLIFVFSCFVKISVSQNIEYRNIPLVKEKTEADSIVEDFKKSNHLSVYRNDSCFLLNIIKIQSKRYDFVISYVDDINSTIGAGNDILRSPDLKYFKFKNNLVFVVGGSNLANLFAPTSDKNLFKFKNLKVDHNKLISSKELYSIAYKYVNGRFIPNYSESPAPAPK